MQLTANHSGGYVGLRGPRGLSILSELEAQERIEQIAQLVAPEAVTVVHRKRPLNHEGGTDRRPRFAETYTETVTAPMHQGAYSIGTLGGVQPWAEVQP